MPTSLAGSVIGLELLNGVDRALPHLLVDRPVAEAAALEERREPVHRRYAMMAVEGHAAEVSIGASWAPRATPSRAISRSIDA